MGKTDKIKNEAKDKVGKLHHQLKALKADQHHLTQLNDQLQKEVIKRKNAENEMRLFRDAVATSTDAVGMSTPDGKHWYQNEAFDRMFGDIGNDPPATLYIDESVGRQVFETIMAGKSWTGEVQMHGTNNKILDINLRAYAVKDDEGRVTGLVGVHTDITERKIAEQALRQSEMKYKSLFDNSISGIGLSQGNRIISANKAMLDIFGYTLEEFLNIPLLDHVAPESQQMIRKNMEKAKKEGPQTYLFEYKIIRKDKQSRDIALSSVPITIDGETYNQTTLQDITERKHAEKERENFIKQLNEKKADLASIISIISHDLRSPLTTSNGFGKILTEQCAELKVLVSNDSMGPDIQRKIENIVTDGILESLDFILKSNERIGGLLESLVKLARLGKSAIEYDELRMNDLIEGILKTLTYQVNSEHINIDVQPLPDCIGDRSQIAQIFTNLINNSIKYRNTDKQCLIKITGHYEDNDSVYCVQDNGIGIDPKYHERIFEIFYRLDTGGDVTGEGMGLSIIKRILDRNNGSVWLESKPDQGSKFYIALPSAKID